MGSVSRRRSDPPAAQTAPAPPVLTFERARDWERWLSRHYREEAGAWLRLRRKGVGDPMMTNHDAVEVALCYGWIDGLARREDESWWMQRFTPRRKRSAWSQINRDRAEALIASGRMRPSGLAEVERAKADGRWDAAYAPFSRTTVPPDLQAALDVAPAARAFFTTLDSKNRFAVIFRLHQAKKPETRARRLAAFVEMLARGERIHP